MLPSEIENQVVAAYEATFGTKTDPDQMQVTQESREKITKLMPNWLVYRVGQVGELMAFANVVPTTREVAERFLSGEITEREILELTKSQERYTALYLCSAVTLPEYRRQGLALELSKELIANALLTDDALLFAWIFSNEGDRLVRKLESELGREIKTRVR